jgi:thiamine-monophosphate kinase
MRTELQWIERIRRAARKPRGSRLLAGIGDDCAIYRPRDAAEDLLLTTDLLIEDVHFRRETHTPEVTGHKALARGLSDLAAMGGSPAFCLLSLALAPWTDERWIDRFYRGLLALAHKTRTPLAGGDLARAKKAACDIVVVGETPRGKALLRSGARAGDAVYVSGKLGGSALGLKTRRGAAWRRHLRPEPRLALGRYLREHLHATAAMDLSDGLSLDLRRLCLASGVAASITAPPTFPGATLQHALHGGEDYELLFTVKKRTTVPSHFQSLPLTCIGAIRSGPAGAVDLDGRPLPALGYDHLR